MLLGRAREHMMMNKKRRHNRLQTIHPTGGCVVTAVTHCCPNCVETSRHSNGDPIYHFLGKASRPAGWLALFLIKVGDVETNPGPTTTYKKVWICDICHKQIHCRKKISKRCNMIEHFLHLRCAGICQVQYTDTWTCHIHRESGLITHTDITPPHSSRPWSNPPTHSPPTPPIPPQPKYKHTSHTLFLFPHYC